MKTNNNNTTTTKQNTHKRRQDKEHKQTQKKNKDNAKNANANKIMVPLKELKAVYVLSSAAGGQLQSQYGT
jgi:Asp-tRNA(Asn)/Glu-tRNA(Gln) amidotransferase C subunit